MRERLLLILLICWTLAPQVRASDPVGVYAIVDRVELNPNEQSPQTIRIFGAFSFAQGRSGDQYTRPVRGYLYYSLPSEKPERALAEWTDLRSLAGGTEVIAFGSRYQPAARVRNGTYMNVNIEPPALAPLLAGLDDAKQEKRDEATEQLKRIGPACAPALKAALQGNVSPEVRGRIEDVLKTVLPDPYPIGFGLRRVPRERAWDRLQPLFFIPSCLTPSNNYVDAGKVTLIAGAAADHSANLQYVFEIESPIGDKETSQPLSGSDKIKWTPTMELKGRQVYTWRVWTQLNGEAKSDPVSATFHTK